MKSLIEKYRKWRKAHPFWVGIKQIVGIIALVMAVALGIAIRFIHADLTETQLFLECWPEYLGVFGLIGIAAFCIDIWR